LGDAPQGFDGDGAVDRRVEPGICFGKVLNRIHVHGIEFGAGNSPGQSLDSAQHIGREVAERVRHIRGHQVPAGVEVRQCRQQLRGIVGEILQHVQIPAERVNCQAVARLQSTDEFEHTFARVGLKIESRVELIEEHDGRVRHRFAEAVDPIGHCPRSERGRRCRGTRRTGAENVDALRLALIENREIVFG
jgi:hypothetical protein